MTALKPACHRPRRRAAAPVGALLLAAALWGLATTGTKYALGGLAPITLLTVELVAGTAALWVALLVRGYRRPGSWRRVAVLGLLEPAGAYLAETTGLNRTSAANGAVLLGFESVFVVALAFGFLGERATRPVCLAVGLALLGFLALESGAGLRWPDLGDLLLLVSALSAAGYTVLARDIGEDADTLAITAHQFAVATLALLPIAVGTWAGGAEPVPVHVPGRFWLVAVLVGVAGFGVSFLLYNRAITTVAAGPSAVIINLIPAFGFVSAVVLLGEAVTLARLTGAALITASVLLFAWTQRPARQLRMACEPSRSPAELVPT